MTTPNRQNSVLLLASVLAIAVPLLAAASTHDPSPAGSRRLAGRHVIEDACTVEGTPFFKSRVVEPWTVISANRRAPQAQYCVLRGGPDADYEFQRDADLVQFSVVGRNDSKHQFEYSFIVETSRGRTFTQGPAIITASSGVRALCRPEVCQFFTEPGERVTRVDVKVERQRRG